MATGTVSFEAKYQEMLLFLYGMERFGILLGLDNVTDLLHKLGNPQTRFPAIHVAGSNGKGSTAAFINGVLMDAGYTTALYTSPHLNDFRERVKLNGKLISKRELYNSIEKIKPLYNQERTTFFELTTAAAFDCIAAHAPDIGIIEVGLGGRLDATNTINSIVTIITDISHEHEDYLGKGLAAIAGEKAGIIKKGVPLITGASRSEAREVILKKASELAAPVKEFGKDYFGKRTGIRTFDYSSRERKILGLAPTMPGSHQIKNACAAIAAVEELIKQHYEISEENIRKGISSTIFPGRFEVVAHKPDVILDGAHTPEGMRLLKSSYKALYPGTKPFLLLGILSDKNYMQLLSIIVPIAREVMCVPPQGARALDVEKLATAVKSFGIEAEWADRIEDGFNQLKGRIREEDVILCTGSLYMIGPVRLACGLADA